MTFWQIVIDVVKLDAEGAEWPCLVDWLTSGVLDRVKQLVLEVHTPKLRKFGQTMALEDYQRIVKIFEMLKEQGFQKYLFHSKNECCRGYADWGLTISNGLHCCYELFYLNLRYL